MNKLDVLDLIHCYEIELWSRTGKRVSMYPRQDWMRPEDSKHWKHFEKTAKLVEELSADPHTFLKTQFQGMGTYLGRKLLPQPSMLCSPKAAERYRKYAGEYVTTHEHIDATAVATVQTPLSMRVIEVREKIKRMVEANGWENTLAWLQNDRYWEYFDNDYLLYHAFCQLGHGALVVMPRHIMEGARNFALSQGLDLENQNS